MKLEVELSPTEARLFGVLIEKSFTTPDQYPLTLNALINGANQKTNREPVMAIDEDEALLGIEGLITKHLIRRVFPENSRVEKYSHRGGEMLVLPAESLAILAELLLRGSQTSGELRVRASRMRPMSSIEELMNALTPAIERGYVFRSAPGPGSRAEKYGQLLCPQANVPAAESVACSDDLAARVAELESRVESLWRRLESLATQLGVEPEDQH